MKQRQSTPDAGISIDASDTAQSMRNEAPISDTATNAPRGEASSTRGLTVGGNGTDGRLTILGADGKPIADMQAATANPRRQDIELALAGTVLRVKEIRDKGAAAVSVTTIPAGEVATAGVIGAAPVAKTVIRDRLELTHDFIASLELPPQPAPTSTVRFVARDIVVNAPGDLSLGVLIENYHVDVIADTVDLRDGIVATAPLSPADLQVEGIDGPDIRVLCRELRGAGLISFGQTGGAGTKGEDGTRATFKSDFDEQTGNIECFMVQPPGAGKDGGPGATGGDSGQISLAYVLDSVPGGFTPGSLLPGGGGGGEGGEGGDPGAVDPPDSSCEVPDELAPSGNRGPADTDGSAKPVQVAVLSSEEYLAALRSVLGEELLAAWRAHRLRSADYFLRAFRPNDPRSIYLTLARDEATAVLAMGPT